MNRTLVTLYEYAIEQLLVVCPPDMRRQEVTITVISPQRAFSDKLVFLVSMTKKSERV
jgi:hypothetical protein